MGRTAPAIKVREVGIAGECSIVPIFAEFVKHSILQLHRKA